MATPSTFTSLLQAHATSTSLHRNTPTHKNNDFFDSTQKESDMENSSTSRGILIGMLSASSFAILIALIIAIIYFFRNTTRGRILLDRMGRPGQYDDEQAMLREEAEALETMDDLHKAEYLRAKGMSFCCKDDSKY
jgi:hypothetical protein